MKIRPLMIWGGLIGLWGLVWLWFSLFPTKEMKQAEAPPATKPTAQVKIEDLVVGTGASPKDGQSVVVHYVGTFTDGSEFDSSKKHGKPFEFVLGAGTVIPGWDQGLRTMKVGGKRKLTVPPELGYGAENHPGIPPNSTLVFEIELLKIKGEPTTGEKIGTTGPP